MLRSSARSLRLLLTLAPSIACHGPAPVQGPPGATVAPPVASEPASSTPAKLVLNDREYFEMPGLNVMLGSDDYPEGHQGGVGIIQNGQRVATNGDLRLEPTPGQWQPVPRVVERIVDRERGELRLRLAYPDPEKDRKGFNPIEYPDLELTYTVRVRPEGQSARIIVDLDQPLPAEWVGRVGFNLELFPGVLYGKSFVVDDAVGSFPRQANGPGRFDERGEYQLHPMAEGKVLTVAPESEAQRMRIEAVSPGGLALIDGRGQHNNGWFVVRSPVPADATRGAIEWLVTPHAIPGWRREPVVQVSQVGYHPEQPKIAVIELDRATEALREARLLQIQPDGAHTVALTAQPEDWGEFLRYRYGRLDFSQVRTPGIYVVQYGETRSAPFRIDPDIYARDVWQPTLETFLPVQMCHMRINDRYRVWHDTCHVDDALMAPTSLNHFDGYVQGPSTLTKYRPGQHVPGLDRGGWHDAGDHDLRVESQADTVWGLALAWEAFEPRYDNTTVDQENRVVELHRPDGVPDLLQQVEHGLLSVVGGFDALGRLYRGIITPTLRQYVLLGDAAAMTDGEVRSPKPNPDDNWVFTEENPGRELAVAAALAAGARVMRGYDDALARRSLAAAETLWSVTREQDPVDRVAPAVELLLATGKPVYRDFLAQHAELVAKHFEKVGWVVGRSVPLVEDPAYRSALEAAAETHGAHIDALSKKTPYGVPYEPAIWGAGWSIQNFGMQQYFLHTAFPAHYSMAPLLDALNFVLGVHPGSNTTSFVSGVGAKSLTVAYGVNRGDVSFIPGGIGSGTALIRPDFPELLEWPYLWQQAEYVLGHGTTDYLILALGAQQLLAGADPDRPQTTSTGP